MVYQEESIDVDSYHAVVDTKCTKTDCGKSFMDAFIAFKGNDFKVERRYEDENFKFEGGKVYNSSTSHSMEVRIGELKTTLETYVVDANIPLLLGMDYLKKWVVIIDTGTKACPKGGNLSDDAVEHEEYKKPFEAEEDIKGY